MVRHGIVLMVGLALSVFIVGCHDSQAEIQQYLNQVRTLEQRASLTSSTEAMELMRFVEKAQQNQIRPGDVQELEKSMLRWQEALEVQLDGLSKLEVPKQAQELHKLHLEANSLTNSSIDTTLAMAAALDELLQVQRQVQAQGVTEARKKQLVALSQEVASLSETVMKQGVELNDLLAKILDESERLESP